MDEILQVTASLTLMINKEPQTFTSTVVAPKGQEGIMLDMAWAHTRRQAEEALKCQQGD